MTNFDYLKKDDCFNSFSDIAIVAEKTLNIDVSTCIVNCRRAMEQAIKWMYSVDSSLRLPYQYTLNSLIKNEDFQDIIDHSLFRRLEYIRINGNVAAHGNKKLSRDVACL